MMTKDPGPAACGCSRTALDIRFEKTFGMRFPDAYERLLIDVIRGNATLFMRRDEVEAAWAWVGARHGGVERPPRPSASLSCGKLGSHGCHRADRAGRKDLARGDRLRTGAERAVTQGVPSEKIGPAAECGRAEEGPG